MSIGDLRSESGEPRSAEEIAQIIAATVLDGYSDGETSNHYEAFMEIDGVPWRMEFRLVRESICVMDLYPIEQAPEFSIRALEEIE